VRAPNSHLFSPSRCCNTMALLLSIGIMCVLSDAASADDNSTDFQETRQFIVKLHRQRVPIRSNSEAMSYKSVYFGTVFIGSPKKQEFSMVFDTGSGHVVVPSSRCKSPSCRIHRRYVRKASRHAEDVDEDGTRVERGKPRDQITVNYGTGEITGQFVSDSLCLSDGSHSGENGETSENSSAPLSDLVKDCVGMRVVVATEMTDDPFQSFAFDGVFGLGLDELALAPEFSFFGQLVAQRKVARSMFAVFLAEHEDDQSEICFGGYSPDRLHGEFLWSPVALPELGYWQVRINSIRVGNKSFNFCDDGQCRAVVDTGTSLIAAPEAFEGQLRKELSTSLQNPSSAAGEVVDCRRAVGAPLHFDIDGLTITLDAGDYARQEAELDDGSADEIDEAEVKKRMESARCEPTLLPVDMPAPLGPKLFIWGEPVLRKYYTLYDVAQKRVGFGEAVHLSAEAYEDKDFDSEEPLLAIV